MNKLQQVYNAAIQVFGERRYVFILLSFALAFFALFVFIPVITTPGNTLAFQLSIFRTQDYFFMVLLAFLVGLNFSMNIYAWRKSKQSANISQSAASPVRNFISNGASDATAGFGGVFAAIVGTASCASCLAFLFGIVGLGIGSVAFVLKYQTFFLLGAIALVLFSLYFTARKALVVERFVFTTGQACPVPKVGPSGTGVNKHCASCNNV